MSSENNKHQANNPSPQEKAAEAGSSVHPSPEIETAQLISS